MRRTGWMTVAALVCAVALGCSKSSSSRSVATVTVSGPPPAALTLTGIDPTFGPVGGSNQVQIFGTGFLTGANVDFDGNAGTNAQVLSPTTPRALWGPPMLTCGWPTAGRRR